MQNPVLQLNQGVSMTVQIHQWFSEAGVKMRFFCSFFQFNDVGVVRERIDFLARQLGKPSGPKGTGLQAQQADRSKSRENLTYREL